MVQRTSQNPSGFNLGLKAEARFGFVTAGEILSENHGINSGDFYKR